MKPKQETNSTLPHTGAMLQKAMKEKMLSTGTVGKLTGRKGSTIKTYFKNASIQTYVLWKLSLALKHNFFSDLAQHLDQSAGAGALDNGLWPVKTQLAALEKENEQLRQERDYLRKAVDAISARQQRNL